MCTIQYIHTIIPTSAYVYLFKHELGKRIRQPFLLGVFWIPLLLILVCYALILIRIQLKIRKSRAGGVVRNFSHTSCSTVQYRTYITYYIKSAVLKCLSINLLYVSRKAYTVFTWYATRHYIS